MTVIDEKTAASRAHFYHHRGSYSVIFDFRPLDFSVRIDRNPVVHPVAPPGSEGRKKRRENAGVTRADDRFRSTLIEDNFFPHAKQQLVAGKGTVGRRRSPTPAAYFRDCELSPMQASADNAPPLGSIYLVIR